MLFCVDVWYCGYQNFKWFLYSAKIQQNSTNAKKNEKNFTKPTCRHPFARLATVSRAPVGFPPHPPSLSLVFQFFHSSAYARVFLSLFSLIGVILFCPISPLLLFFLIRVTTISFSFFFS